MRTRAVLGAWIALSIVLSAPAAWAQSPPPPPDQNRNNPTALDFWIDDRYSPDTRKDVEEAGRALPPGGPATPIPYCGPSAPVCP